MHGAFSAIAEHLVSHATLLARYQLWVGVCLYVCLSVTSRCSIETTGRIGLVLGMEASFDLGACLSYCVKFGYLKIRVRPCVTVSNSEHRKFHHGASIAATCCQLYFTQALVDAQCDKLRWQYLLRSTFDHQPANVLRKQRRPMRLCCY